MKYYIASKLENHAEHNRLRDALAAMGHEITYDWTVHGPVYREGLGRCTEVAVAETKGVIDADFVVVLWPGGRGTHVELGMAIAAGKPVIFISGVEAHHEATTETCAFYHHPLVSRGRHWSEVPSYLPDQRARPDERVGRLICAARTFVKDWRDGDFALPRLAEIHAEGIAEKVAAIDA